MISATGCTLWSRKTESERDKYREHREETDRQTGRDRQLEGVRERKQSWGESDRESAREQRRRGPQIEGPSGHSVLHGV